MTVHRMIYRVLKWGTCHKSIKVIINSPLSSSDALLIRVATQTSFSLSRYGAHA